MKKINPPPPTLTNERYGFFGQAMWSHLAQQWIKLSNQVRKEKNFNSPFSLPNELSSNGFFYNNNLFILFYLIRIHILFKFGLDPPFPLPHLVDMFVKHVFLNVSLICNVSLTSSKMKIYLIGRL